VRRLAALAIMMGALIAPGTARAQTSDVDSVESNGASTTLQPSLFTLTSSDLTGPIPVPDGQGIWRTLALRNVSTEYRLTIGLAGLGPAEWVRPAMDQVELAPGQQQIVRLSVTAAKGAVGTHEVGVTATILEAKSVLIIGESPMITAERKDLWFTVEIAPEVTAASDATARPDADIETDRPESSIETAAEVDFGRIGLGLAALIALMAMIWMAPRVMGRTARVAAARAAARELVETKRTSRRPPRGRRAELLGEARRAATSVLAERAARARRRAESAAEVAATAQAAAVRARDHSLAQFADRRIAAEATRQLAHRVETDDRAHAARAQAESRIVAKQTRIDLARRAARAQLEAARDAEVDRHTFAELSRAAWLQARTEGARSRMSREPLERWAPLAGAEPLAFEAAITDRPVPPPPAIDADSSVTATEFAPDDCATALASKPSRTKRAKPRRERTEVLALDVEVLNRVLEARRDRDAFDERATRLSAR
jgi:hypothetical protein